MVIGLVLLVSGAMKGYALATTRTAGDGVLRSRWVVAGLFEFELFLGLWLLSGVYARQARAVALACFAAFLAFSASQVLAGETSCGCFGNVAVSPWVTAGFDLAAVAALACWRPSAARWEAIRSKPVWSAGFAAAALLVLSLGAVAAARYQPARLSEEGDIVGEGGAVVLEPEKWVGKRLPLLRHIDIGPQLALGHWIVVLYRRDCKVCQEELLQYEQLAEKSARRLDGLQVVLVEVPQLGKGNRVPDEGKSSCVRGQLSSTSEWFVKVPVTLQVRDGRVTAVQTPE